MPTAAGRLIARVTRRPPDFVIGGAERPYMLRWHLLKTRWLSVYLHQILRSDDDRALHDHRADNVSILLRGCYDEVMPCPLHPEALHLGHFLTLRRHAGDIVRRRAEALHRLELVDAAPCWTLWIKGRERRDWGFACRQGWVPWQVFTAADDSGQVGRGCD